ncbi:hypothetical protein Pelo_16828 [Pelomyxa schiedti]|nr:hypothetical protein Pelo_16828 [Pelomyxa schiedti]
MRAYYKTKVLRRLFGEGVVHRLARVVDNRIRTRENTAVRFRYFLYLQSLHFRICGTVVDFAGRDDSLLPRSILSLLNIGHTTPTPGHTPTLSPLEKNLQNPPSRGSHPPDFH